MLLDNMSVTPLYKQLEEMLLTEIERGVLKPGIRIPTEIELSEQYHVSRVTVRKALAALSDAGYLERKSGKGTFVAEKKMQRNLSSTVLSFTEMCQLMNMVPGAKTHKIALEEPTPKEAEQMNLSKGENIIVIKRVRYADGKPIMLEWNKFPETFNFLFNENLNDISLYEILRTKYNISLDHSSKTIDIVFASAQEAKALDITKGYPLLRISSVIRDSSSSFTNLCLQLYIGDKYKIIV